MGPKAKNKKGARKAGPEIDPKEIVTELMKQFFEIQLADIDKKITRLNERENELKSDTAEMEARIEEYRREKGVIVSEHEQILALKESEKVQKREEMLELSENIKIRIANHKKRVQQMEKRFVDMVNDLTGQLEALEEDVNILEDYKQNKDLYADQLRQTQAQIEHMEIEHQRTLFAIEAKCKLTVVRVKKELESRLLQMSIEFQQFSQKKIGSSCHRVTTENKAIERELRLIENEIQDYREKRKTLLTNLRLIKGQEELRKMERDKAIARTFIQGVVVQNLFEERIKLLENLKEYSSVETENTLLLKRLRVLNSDIEKKELKMEEVKRLIESKIEETASMNEALTHLKKTSRRLHVLIRNALKIAEEGLAVQLIPMGGTEEEKFMNSDAKIRLFKKRRDSAFQKKGRILQYLLDVLAKAQMSDEDKKLLRASADTIDLETINFGIIYGQLEKESEAAEALVLAAAETEKTSLSLGSDVSLPRSESVIITPPEEKSESESEMGEYEGEYEEEDILEGIPEEETIEKRADTAQEHQDEVDKGSEVSEKS